MKKLISVLMCFALLLSCCTFAAALGRPSLQIISHRESLSAGEYVCFNLAVKTVGLDTATDAQCRAAGVSAANDFTAEIARTILRRAVGLDA